MVELLHCRTPLGTNLRQARRDGKALCTLGLPGARSRVDFSALALDALPLRCVIVGSMHRKGRQQQRRQQAT